MSLLHALVLGIVQGFSEFLPISSSGHLELVGWAFGWNDFAGNESLEQAFDVALHIGTLIGIVVYLWQDIVGLVSAGIGDPLKGRGLSSKGKRAWLLLGTAVPASLVGLLFQDLLLKGAENVVLIAAMLILFGLVLLWADRSGGTRDQREFEKRDAILLGVGQAFALQPGVSRSGVTMSVARKLNFSREATAKIVFLMSLPVIAGAGVYRAVGVMADGGVPQELIGGFLVGVAAAGVSGFLTIWGFLKLVRKASFVPFVIYRCVLGGSILLAVAMGVST